MSVAPEHHEENGALRARRLGIDTLQEPIVYMREDCSVCRSEGFTAMSRLKVSNGSGRVLATLNIVQGDLLDPGEVGFSEVAWKLLGAQEGDLIRVEHAEPVESFAFVRGKLYGRRFEPHQLQAIIDDIVAGRYTDVQISAFVAAGSDDRLDDEETVSLTRAMLESGERLQWHRPIVVDKHCVGGLPGNRTTPIVVAIAADAGLTMPKTSSRAITSPAGTADTMEVLTRVNLSLSEIREVVEQEGACLVWGGSVRLSPADDILIRVERALDIDSEAQLIASVLSKKVAAGSTHVVLDVPVGPTAKVRSAEDARRLCRRLVRVGERIGLHVLPVVTDGLQPVGRGIGPALEARDVLAVLRLDPDAPTDLRERALTLAACVLQVGGAAPAKDCAAVAAGILESGRAWKKFLAICEAQGEFREPSLAPFCQTVPADADGRVVAIDNRCLSRVAKLAGAPADPTAGVLLRVRIGEAVPRGATLFEVHAESRGELAYALAFLASGPNPVQLGSVG
jgi:thymidine phosphorylase